MHWVEAVLYEAPHNFLQHADIGQDMGHGTGVTYRDADLLGVWYGARAQAPRVGRAPGPGTAVNGCESRPVRSCANRRRACMLRFRFQTLFAVSCLRGFSTLLSGPPCHESAWLVRCIVSRVQVGWQRT